ncbi:MAG: universal stress protein [Deltaproteobacteria bacterium]|nr:universal stress protein [Deltaproteobacteria bacterium]
MNSIYFCKQTRTILKVFIPEHLQFLMYFQNEIATVDLEKAFLKNRKTAREHAEAIITANGLNPNFLDPKQFTASTLMDIPVDFRFMTCPRSISDLSTKISLGHIGPKVRSIIKNASFPVFIPSPVFKEWKSITVFFGGSENAVKTMKIGLQISRWSGFPMRIFTQLKKKSRAHYRDVLKENDLLDEVESNGIEWTFFKKGKFRENLYEIPHDSLVLVGAYGHSAIKEVLFGSMMEEIQTVLPNHLVIVGPHARLG